MMKRALQILIQREMINGEPTCGRQQPLPLKNKV